jgi:hypothetical protein
MFARTALRLITVAALTGTADLRPTIAADRIDDSRLADLAPETVPDDGLPVIMVICDDDDGEAWSEQNGGPPFDRMIDLNIEMSIASRVQYIDPTNLANSTYVVEAPDTDARLEASIDLMEFQTIRELAYGLSPFSIMFRKLARITHRACHRAATDDGVKIASRILTLKCRVNDDDIEIVSTAAAPSEGLDALPEPLRSVAKILPAGSTGLLTCTALAAKIVQLTTGPLAGVDLTADARDHAPTPEPTDAQIEIKIDLPQPT